MFSAVEKVVPHSPGVLDFAFVLVNSVVNLPDKWGELSFYAYQNFFGGGVTYTKPPKRHLQNFPTQKKLQINKVRTQKIFGSSTSLEIRSTLSGAVAIACPKDTL